MNLCSSKHSRVYPPALSCIEYRITIPSHSVGMKYDALTWQTPSRQVQICTLISIYTRKQTSPGIIHPSIPFFAHWQSHPWSAITTNYVNYLRNPCRTVFPSSLFFCILTKVGVGVSHVCTNYTIATWYRAAAHLICRNLLKKRNADAFHQIFILDEKYRMLKINWQSPTKTCFAIKGSII